MPSVLKADAFRPTLFASPVALTLTDEQRVAIREVLRLSSSDSFFAEKAYQALRFILLGNNVRVPVLNSLSPNTVTLGSPPFLLHAYGSQFSSTSVITFNGIPQITTFVSASEVTTMVDISAFTQPLSGDVAVTDNNVSSTPLPFTITV